MPVKILKKSVNLAAEPFERTPRLRPGRALCLVACSVWWSATFAPLDHWSHNISWSISSTSL